LHCYESQRSKSTEDLDRAVGAYATTFNAGYCGGRQPGQYTEPRTIGQGQGPTGSPRAETKPGDSVVRMGLPTTRDYEQAVATYRERLRLRPDDATAWYSLGDAYGQIGQGPKAIRLSVKLLADPKLAQAGLTLVSL
jgi:tetratricopeptide (TPR) repeat protein